MTWFWLILAAVQGARAQGISQWVSPGPLAADHAALEGLTNCTKCHAPMRGVTTERCVACHEEVGGEIAGKYGFHANKADRCGSCHVDHQGRQFQLARLELSSADHQRETGFPLDGAHGKAACLDCHRAGDWKAVEPECSSCHDTPHGSTDHVDVGTCSDCHTTVSWAVRDVPEAVFDHRDPKDTDYVLEGAHVDVGCVACHLDARFVPTAFEKCTSCHRDPHQARLPQGCTTCHAMDAWVVPDFDHYLSGYPLEGLHSAVTCEKCHGADVTEPLPHGTCKDCHKDVHKGQFGKRTCDTCHTVVDLDFRIPAFDHTKTAYPLVGEHTTVACAECHGAGVKAKYVPVGHADCDDCHEDPHAAKFEPTDCRTCHAETGWAVGEFDHGRTDFPLIGAHLGVACESCHPNEQWSGIAHETCDACHADHPHGAAFTPASCAECHTELDWVTITFAHAEETPFDLAPQHTTLPCTGCHEVLDAFAGLDSTCVSCHADDDPAGHYDGACDTCHVTAEWLPATLGGLSHDVTGYPLVGTHTLLACEDCHGNTWAPLSASGTDCVDCHADDDSHRNLLGDVCEDCHSPTSWLRTSFRHTVTGYPLRGAHRLASCDDCHAVGYAGTPDTCWRCHEAEASRSETAHQSVFFPYCDTCHRPYTWAALPAASFGTPTGRR